MPLPENYEEGQRPVDRVFDEALARFVCHDGRSVTEEIRARLEEDPLLIPLFYPPSKEQKKS